MTDEQFKALIDKLEKIRKEARDAAEVIVRELKQIDYRLGGPGR